MITIIIVNYNLTTSIDRLLESIFKYTKEVNFDVYVVDNNSPDRTIRRLVKKYPNVNFVFLKNNYGFGYANNVIFNKVNSDYYLLLNPDTLLLENSVLKLYEFMERKKDAGIVGATLINEDGGIQESALKFPRIYHELFDVFGLTAYGVRFVKKLRHKILNENYYKTEFIFGSCFMIRKEVIDVTKGFDEDYFLFAEETDLCFRMQRLTKYKTYFFRKTNIVHVGGKATNKREYERIRRLNMSKLLFFNKNYSEFYVFLLRILKILSFYERSVRIVFRKEKKVRKKHFATYKYLIKKYWLNQSH
jgi:GT2 family glycosyltransferase